ncbi:MAG TPA: hypothetical protein VHP30_15275 [Ignavibacteriales bacterium]|nr:hypothetical protein [Ignavibacteriales bacterium]
MKRDASYIILSAFLVLLPLASGCGDDSNPVSGETPLTGLSTAVIKAKIHPNFAGLTVNYKQDLVLSANIMGSCKVDAEGNFNITVGEPSAAFLLGIEDFITPGIRTWQGDLYISDTTARFLTGRLFIYKDDATYEVIWHKEPDVKISNTSATYYENNYYYVNKDLEVKGEIKYGNSDSYVYKINFRAKAGWNVLLRTSYYSYINNKANISYTNYIPSGSEFFECKDMSTIIAYKF